MKNHRQTFNDSPLAFSMIFVEEGTFTMGSESKIHFNDEVAHFESVNNFWIGENLVTQLLWEYVMQGTEISSPSIVKGHNHPVEQISWNDINWEFLPRLNKITEEKRPNGTLYRLPTEAEWEYAALGGKYGGIFPFEYSGSNKLNEVGWYSANSHGETKPVGLKSPNLLGIFDMCGNVREWCADIWQENTENNNQNNTLYALRSGSRVHSEEYCRIKYHRCYPANHRTFDIGFRLALS